MTADHTTISSAQPTPGFFAMFAALTLLALALTAAPALASEVHAFSAAFGEAGSGPGQLHLTEQSGIAFSQANQDIYVADTGNGRVEQFEADGTFIRSFGSFTTPTFVAVDNNSSSPSFGNIYVADSAKQTVSKFKADGTAATSWGTGGRLSGSGTDPFGKDLDGIGVNTLGDLVVLANTEHETISKSSMFTFKQDGTFASVIALHRPNLPLAFVPIAPRGIAIDNSASISSGDLYGLYLRSPHETLKYNAVGEWIDEVESRPSTTSQGLTVDASNGDLYIDHGTEITSRDASGNIIEPSIGLGASVSSAQGLAVGSGHSLYVASVGSQEVVVFTVQDVEPPSVFIEPPTEVSYTTAHVTGVVDTKGHARSTVCRFEYLTEAEYQANLNANPPREGFFGASVVPCATNPSGSGLQPVEAAITGLKTSTNYHLRLAATNPAGTAYSAEPNLTVETKAVPKPSVTIDPVTAVTGNTAHFSGHVNPNAPKAEFSTSPEEQQAFLSSWHFQCSPSCPGLGGVVAADNTSHEVSASATGLRPGTAYEVSLVAQNAGGANETTAALFATPAIAPGIDSTFASSTTATAFVLNAQINPNGAPTTAHFEYLTEAQFLADGESFGEGTQVTAESSSIGSNTATNPSCTPKEEESSCVPDAVASQPVSGLQPETAYLFRVVATNEKSPPGGTLGPATTFITYSTASISSGCVNEALREENTSLALPDCRAYERVSPSGNAEVYAPAGVKAINSASQVETSRPMQSTPDGSAITYAGEPPSSGEGDATGGSGKNSSGDQYLATRAPDHWTTTDIAPLGHGQVPSVTAYQAFTDDLSIGVLQISGSEPQLLPGVEAECNVLYSRNLPAGPYHSFFTGPDCGEPIFVGASADGSTLLFESSAAMTANAQPSLEEPGHNNIYDVSDGQIHLINVLPGSEPHVDPNATVGALPAEPPLNQNPLVPPVNTSNIVSVDGSRVFWTDLDTGIVYLRENPTQSQSKVNGAGKCTQPSKACTVPISAGPASYQTATPDGRYAYYIEAGQLWRFDVDAELREPVTPSGAGVLGVIGVNRKGTDGAYLYFVAEAGLAGSGAESRACEIADRNGTQTEKEEAREETEGKAPVGRGCNLYLLHEGQAQLVAILSPADNQLAANKLSTPTPAHGVWSPIVGYRAAQLTPDGHSLLFMSVRRLTAYDNVGRSGNCGTFVSSSERRLSTPCAEIYVYSSDDEPSDAISCASCSPTGAPIREAENAHPGEETLLPFNFEGLTRATRLISADGSRVFFDTYQALSPADTNGQQDVYEWERQGSGSCEQGSPFNNHGCVFLVSGGKDAEYSSLIETDEGGDNVFFTTRQQLTPLDRDGKADLYDARVDGGFPVPSEIICEAEACKGPFLPPPTTQTPGTSSFQANEPPPTKCKKGKVKKRGKCVAKKHKSKKHKKKAHGKKSHRAASHNRGGQK